MTSTAPTKPTEELAAIATNARSWRNAVQLRPQDYATFSEWVLASLTALREHVSSTWQMTRTERVAAYTRGELTHEQIQEWVGRAPREVPSINGEFAHIAASTPEACVACPYCGDDEVALAAGGVLHEHADYRDPNWGKSGAYAAGDVATCPGSGTPVPLGHGCAVSHATAAVA